MKIKVTTCWIGIITAFLIILPSCKSYNIKPNLIPQERFELAKKMFNNRDFFEAKTQFKILTLSNPGIQFIDEAQYYLAECHFNLKEYIIASDEYSRIIRLYPKSEWLDDAQYKIAICDFKLSPKPSLDQKYTILAVMNFQRFLEDFPKSEYVPEAERLLKICRNKLAEKEFKAGELYRKLNNYYAANVYFDSVLESYYDTKFAESALFWKSECLYKLDHRNEALKSFRELIEKYPKTKYKAKAISRLKEIQSKIMNVREADGDAALSNQTKNN
ncbi:MAG: outer membrane protein assembly factor BamD [bacterium]